MDSKKAINKNVPTTRLQSLKLPRDFTLGSSTKPKKQYAPNLNVVRNKDKCKEFLKEIEKKRKDKVISKSNNRKTTNGLNHSRFIQSNGIFSQGSADIQRPNGRTERRSNGLRDSETASNLILPTINRNTWAVNKKTEDVVLGELLNNEDGSDDDNDDLAYRPLTLHVEDTIGKLKIEADILPKISDKSLLPEPFKIADVYNDDNPSFSLIQLPLSFAGKGLSDDPNDKTLTDYRLSDMLEGKIGTLKIRKSGKMEVQLGNMPYELVQRDPKDYEEELVLTGEDERGYSCLSVLGNVDNTFQLMPNFFEIFGINELD